MKVTIGSNGFYINISANTAWEGLVTSLFYVVLGGGPFIIVWSYVLAVVASVIILAAVAEVASVAPSPAAQTYWAAVHISSFCRRPDNALLLIPVPRLAPTLLKQITGWLMT
ncbi:hypothetical protein SLS56_012070 [Neofusicoccum ribis]|uniref:Uncharacterized protein n=1 Tax=Neofusicoccum ribis TaxID=45134 RepID=A0ABR3SAG8_9PEZI